MVPYAYGKNDVFVRTVALASSGGTSTASATDNAVASSMTFSPSFGKVAIRGIKVRITTAPATNHTGVALAFLNGTSTLALASIGTKTAGEVVTATAVGYGTAQTELYDGTSTYTPGAGASIATPLGFNSKAVIAAGSAVTVTLISTATASGMAGGSYSIEFMEQWLPA